MDSKAFRFLDLPVELRCMVYERITFAITCHVLDRAQAHLDKRTWPVPPKARIYDSRITLIRPHIPLEILMKCHSVRKAAHEILTRKAEYCNLQPLRYLVDYSAAWALAGARSNLRRCIGLEDWLRPELDNKAVRDFVKLCTHHNSQMRRPQPLDGPYGMRAIELTISHKTEVVYGLEVLEAIYSLIDINYSGPHRLVIIYKTPLPKAQIQGDAQTYDMSHIEAELRQRILTEPVDSLEYGVFVRPLQEEAFEKHVESLERY